MILTDINGDIIYLGDELDMPLEIFSNGIVVEDEHGDLCVELRYEHKKIKLKHLPKNSLKKIGK
jgi:asparagine synthetase A